MWRTRARLAKLESDIAEIKSLIREAAPTRPEAPHIADTLVKGLADVMSAQATAAPQREAQLFDHVGKMMELVRRDTARHMGAEGGRRSGATRRKKRDAGEAVQQLQEMAKDCQECHYNLHSVPWDQRHDTTDFIRHREQNHDARIAELAGKLPKPGDDSHVH